MANALARDRCITGQIGIPDRSETTDTRTAILGLTFTTAASGGA